jgi:hypothetical protein
MLFRVAAGLAIAAGVNLFAIIVLSLAGSLDFVSACMCLGIMHTGFLGLGLTATPRSPLRPMRFTIGFAIIESGLLVLWLPLQGRLQLAFAVSMIAATVAGIVLLESADRRPRLASRTLAALAAYGVVIVIGLTFILGNSAVARATGLADETISAAFAFASGAAWLSSAWHGRTLWRARGHSGRANVVGSLLLTGRRTFRTGRPLSWRVVFGLWLVTAISGLPVWAEGERVFDSGSGWVAISGGVWFILFVVTLGVSVARTRRAISRPPS